MTDRSDCAPTGAQQTQYSIFRMQLSRRIALALMVLLVCAQLSDPPPVLADTTVVNQNWGQWRGPLANGVSPAGDPPATWSESSNVRWKVKIPGVGTATPIVWGDRVFVQTAIDTGKKPDVTANEPAPPPADAGTRGRRGGFGGAKPTSLHQFVILCLDRKTGSTLWQQIAREEIPHEGRHPTEGSFASNSPVTDGKHVYAYFGSRGLYCYDMEGKLQWSHDFGKMRVFLTFGEGSSPVLYGDSLIVNWDSENGSFITALDKNTGKTLWKTDRDEATAWSTPIVVENNGKPQVITTATKKIRSYDLATGALLWECAGLTRNVIPSPVAGDNMVYAISGYQGNALLAIRLDRTGDLTGTDAVAWSYRKKTPYVPSPLLYQNRIYFFSSNNGILSCLDAKTGRVLIDGQRIEQLQGVYASPVAAAGKIYLVGRDGSTVVIKPADALEVVATNRLDEKFDASPAIAGDEIFLRGNSYLYCLGVK